MSSVSKKIWLKAHENVQNDVGDMFTLVKITLVTAVAGRKIYPANLQFKGNNSSLKGTIHKNLAYRTFCFIAKHVTIQIIRKKQ